MVEQEYSKSISSKTATFPESLISDKSTQNHGSNTWCMNEAISLMKPDDLCNSDLFHMLYGNDLLSDKIISSELPNECTSEKDNLFLETLPKDKFSINDSTFCDLYYNDQNMFDAKDYFDPMSERISVNSDPYLETNSPLSFWGSSPFDLETIKMDDIFQVDKDDLVQSPTLAELNANDESLIDSFDNFDSSLPSESKLAKPSLQATGLTSGSYRLSSLVETSQVKTVSDTSSNRSSLLPIDTSGKDSLSENQMRSSFNPTENKMSSLCPDALIKSSEENSLAFQVAAKVGNKSLCFIESNVKTADVKKFEKKSEFPLPSNHETLDSDDDDSEMDYDYSSDVEEESEEETKIHSRKHTAASILQKKKSRYFWQYNIQSKGPKAPKVKLTGKPAVSDNFSRLSDPVFTSSNLIKGIKHAGKARRGDGNDLTPNPQKLYNIGLELEKLNSVIEGLVPANELPINARSKSRKEKNKLASRACRLKKKAQHEANKLKLFGLQREQKHILGLINEVKKMIKKNIENTKKGKMQSSISPKVEALCMKKCYTRVAGCSAEFVNNVLKSVGEGDRTGGLDIEDGEE